MIITLSTTKLVLAIATALGFVFAINSILPKGQSNKNQICVNCDNVKLQQLSKAAQDALNAIACTRTLSSSEKRANRGQHVFNNRVLGFHRSVLQKLLEVVGGYDEQLENLTQDLVIPLSRTEQEAISRMVAHFSSNEFYVDYNADVFGEYVRQLRAQLVAYLMADTSVNNNERAGIQNIRQKVQFITTEMVNHVVYVDPMARDRWLQEHPRDEQLYEQVRRAIGNMFRNILQDFQKVSIKIKVFRGRNNWNWDRDSDVK
ncbi:uncharacterized protein LOC130562306 isoform X2 [Triplophysa rosa]|uniref:uncharacterized protein LOC130562306 isoform X2 n=1 Tax=Triplophysa rosa TaxID=992332 RepID=UPI002545BE66|nr:uncharacterized protein LOC130562306 isoform X2 [Triplophysa rosa]